MQENINDRLVLTRYEQLVLDRIDEVKKTQDGFNKKMDDISLRMTRVEDGHINNIEKIKDLNIKIDKHIEDFQGKKNIIFTAIVSFISGFFLFYIENIKSIFRKI